MPPPAPPVVASETRVVGLVFATVFLDMIGFGIVLPLMPLYVASLGGSATAVGWLFAGFSLLQLLVSPWLGRLSDRHGRRPVVLFSLLGNALAMGAFAVASEVGWLWLLFASRALAGATAGNLAACQAVLADALPPERRAGAMGKIGAAIGLGMMLGPALGGALHPVGAWVPPALAGCLALLDAGAVALLLPETHPPHRRTVGLAVERPPMGAVLRGAVLRVSLLLFLAFVALANLQVVLALLVQARFGWSAERVGLLFLLFGGISFVVQGLLLGRISAKVGTARLAVLGPSLSAVGLGVVAVSPTPAPLLLGLACLGLGMAITLPSLSTLAAEASSEDARGVVLGVAQSAGGLGRVAGPLLAGSLFTAAHPGRPFLAGAAVSTVAALLSLGLRVQAARPSTER